MRTYGIVTLRQQPEMADGTVFVSLEDETGVVKVICWRRPKVLMCDHAQWGCNDGRPRKSKAHS